jgi:hypothetical protein
MEALMSQAGHLAVSASELDPKEISVMAKKKATKKATRKAGKRRGRRGKRAKKA